MDRNSENSMENAMAEEDGHLEHIERLIWQSAQGFHFMFDHADAAKVLKESASAADELELASFSNCEKVRETLSGFIAKPTLEEKRLYLEGLREREEEYKILVRVYFHLVESSILATGSYRH